MEPRETRNSCIAEISLHFCPPVRDNELRCALICGGGNCQRHNLRINSTEDRGGAGVQRDKKLLYHRNIASTLPSTNDEQVAPCTRSPPAQDQSITRPTTRSSCSVSLGTTTANEPTKQLREITRETRALYLWISADPLRRPIWQSRSEIRYHDARYARHNDERRVCGHNNDDKRSDHQKQQLQRLSRNDDSK